MRPALSAIRMFSSLLALAAVMLIGPAAASAAPTIDGEFAVSGVGFNNELALGPDGNMWVTLDAAGKDVARITPAGVVTEYDSPSMAGTAGITAGPDGNMWITQTGGVAKFSPADPVSAAQTAIASISAPSGITVGPDGNLWTASGNSVTRFDPANPAGATAFGGVAAGKEIATGTDGNLWIADFGAPSQIVSMTTTGVATAYPVSSGPQGIAAGPNGQIAFSDPTDMPHEIGRLTAGGTPLLTETPGKDPIGVAFGADGAYWFANFTGDDLGRLTTDGVYSTLSGITPASGPRRVEAGPGNTLWVTLDTTDKIARVTGVDPPVVDPDPDPDPPTGQKPKVTIDKRPGKKVRARAARTRVKFKFSSATAGAKFECALAKKRKKGKGGTGPKRAKGGFKSCASPAKYKLKPGRYTFSVRASAGDLTGETERAKFKVVRKKN